jgi:beta-lactam-binding protein with PASTA domain
VKLIRVVGETRSAAAQSLGEQGLNVSEIPQTTRNPNMVGLIVKQFPTSLTVVKKGSFVNIYYGVAAPSNSGGGGNTTPATTTITTTTPSSTTTTTSTTTT